MKSRNDRPALGGDRSESNRYQRGHVPRFWPLNYGHTQTHAVTMKMDGLGGRLRTCDLVLPKHARCQLRHTETGSPTRIRTTDLPVNSRALYQLSYRGKENVADVEGFEPPHRLVAGHLLSRQCR